MSDLFIRTFLAGAAILGGASIIGKADERARAHSDERKAVENEKKRKHERYIMEHPDEYSYVKDEARYNAMKAEAAQFKNEANWWEKKYREEKIQKQSEIAALNEKLSEERTKYSRIENRIKDTFGFGSFIDNSNDDFIDVNDVVNILDNFVNEKDKLEALELYRGSTFALNDIPTILECFVSSDAKKKAMKIMENKE